MLAVLVVCLVPLGDHDARLAELAARGVTQLYGLPARVIEARPMPREAWYAPRRRWRAERLLRWLDAEVLPGSGCGVTIGFTDEDVSTTKDAHVDWGVLGLANLGGTAAVVSTKRARRGARGRKLVERVVKIVNHELGHVFGHDHHPVPGCIMNDAGGTVATVDREDGLLCPQSRDVIERRLGRALPALERFDWSQLTR
jgi:archaemetzincin